MVGSKYKDETREQALAMLATGMRVTKVAEITGIPKQTISNWKCRAEEDDEDFRAARELEKRKVVETAFGIFQDALKLVGGQVKAAKKSQQDVEKICQAILVSGADGETIELMQKIVREHYAMSTKDVVGVMNAVYDRGEAVRRSMAETGEGQTVLVEFGGNEEYAG